MGLSVYELAPRFAKLFSGLDTAFGTGRGQWIKRPPRPEDFIEHLSGRGPGIGIAPLRPDNTVLFCAIDLDEPDFDAAREMQTYLPRGTSSFIERSRSGNAHVWVFFKAPLEAWIAMSMLRRATLAAGKKHVEVFPKNWSFERVRLGNYINLPYHGADRPVLCTDVAPSTAGCARHARGAGGSMMSTCWRPLRLDEFVDHAFETANDPEVWRTRARILALVPPEARESSAEFGTQTRLHICAEHVLSGEAGPVGPGSRAVVFFNLAKALTNWQDCDHDEALEMLRIFNAEMVEPSIPGFEVRRILRNAEEKQYTSTGCDDPVFAPFAHPDCPIANPRR